MLRSPTLQRRLPEQPADMMIMIINIIIIITITITIVIIVIVIVIIILRISIPADMTSRYEFAEAWLLRHMHQSGFGGCQVGIQTAWLTMPAT